ncbi:MAG TPA: hypothetical protein DCR93_20955 [Cytophagales bacterium]|nr:hypothetical protein [Cytophagales bacterium]
MYATAQSPYYPLEKGQVTFFRYGDAFNQGNQQLTMKIQVQDETEQIGGNEYLVMETSYGSPGSYQLASKVYARATGGGVVSMENVEAEEQVLLEGPYTVGKTWQQVSDGQTSTLKIVAIQGTLETPAETLTQCLVVESTSERTTGRSYYQRGMGLVAITLIVEGKEQVLVYRVAAE